MKAATRAAGGEVRDCQLREAEEGLVRLLYAKRFPREWIERHAPEAMAQARTDFAARLAAGHEDETVRLLVVIAYRRALKVLRSERTRPQTTSIETMFHLADEDTPTPEQETIDRDRQERVVKAMGRLPERERKLMALVYFENMSIRAAGRRLGWGKSVASRHHQAALERLKAMLDRSLLSPEIAIPAFVASRHQSLPRAARLWIKGAAETIRDAALLGGGRAGPLAETGNAAALSGAGRTAAGVCGATMLACLAGAAGGVVGPGLGALQAADSLRVERAAPARASAASAPDHKPAAALPAGPAPLEPAADAARIQGAVRAPSPRAIPVDEAGRRASSTAPAATAKQTVSEFGVEGGEVEESRSAGGGATETRESKSSSAPIPQAARPSTGSAGAGSSGSPPSTSEFGM
jgi:RNA polymerase sigma factor (sigma-70 family)